MTEFALLESLIRRHRTSALLLADAEGALLAGVTGGEAGQPVRTVARTYGQVLAAAAPEIFARRDEDPATFDPQGERCFVSPVHAAGRRFYFITVGRERAHQAALAEGGPRLWQVLAAREAA